MTILFPSYSTMLPGAVPILLGIVTAPERFKACLVFIWGIIRPLTSKKPLICASEASSITNSVPNSPAIVSLVRSSEVGPSPPVTIIRSALPMAVFTTSLRRVALSPTVV